MKEFREIAKDLSQRLLSFGASSSSSKIIEEAIAANSWFTSSDICGAVEAINNEMLECQKLENWLSCYPTLPSAKMQSVAIIMAGNIPLVGFFDLLCTLAAGHQAWVKPSSKDRLLMEYICSQLKEIEPSIPIYTYDPDREYDAIIATGGNEAIRYFESQFASTKRLCRASRHSVAILTENSTAQEIELLSEDIYSYSGLGCRNVSMIFAPRGYKVALPTRSTSSNYRDNYIHTKALMSLRGSEFEDNGTSILIRSHQRPTTLSTITIWEYDTLAEVEERIAQNDDSIQCIVCSCQVDHPRRVGFGEAQHPTLFDYADGVDTMKFLEFND